MPDALKVGLIAGSKDLKQALRGSMDEAPVRVVLEQAEVGDWPMFLARLDREPVDVVMIELGLLGDAMEDGIRRIKQAPGEPAVIVLHGSADPELILKAMRAGADEYLHPPFEKEVRPALQRLGETRRRTRVDARTAGKLFGFLGVKGGCGTTTIACHIAVELHRQTKREVLLSDFDLDSGIVAFLMKTQNRYTLLDAVENVHRLDISFWRALVSNGTPGVEVIAAPSGGAAFREGGFKEFRDVLQFMRANYDWTVVDLGSGASRLAMTAIGAVDEIFLTTTLDVPALHQAKQTVRVLRDAGISMESIHLLINRVPKRNELSPEEIESMVGTAVYTAIPENSGELFDAYADGSLVGPETHLGKHFARLAGKIAGVTMKPKKRFSFF